MSKRALCVGALALATGLMAASAGAGESMVKYTVSGNAIPQSLTGKPGDPKKGKALVIARKKGNCLACHMMPIPEEADHGQIGPALYGVANRMTPAEMRLRIVDPKVINPNTAMPSFYKTKGLHRVLKKFQGKPILTAQEVEDIVAYLSTLK
ncbi:MAG: sulfur oxidation c-type cytochrome SoxX [Gammaproteobacteria bacterium]